MECALKMASSSICSLPIAFSRKIGTEHTNDVVFRVPSVKLSAISCSAGNVPRLTSVESRFSYDKSIPEEIIEKPVGLALADKVIGDNPRCPSCETKGAMLCKTCSGSGLYVESILESQGIIVKVRCLGCGGTGNTMCEECGGRGHV